MHSKRFARRVIDRIEIIQRQREQGESMYMAFPDQDAYLAYIASGTPMTAHKVYIGFNPAVWENIMALPENDLNDRDNQWG